MPPSSDDALGAEAGELVLREPEPAAVDHLVVGSEIGARLELRERRVPEAKRRVGQADLTETRMAGPGDGPALVQMAIRHHLADLAHRGSWHLRGAEPGEHVVAAERAGPVADHAVEVALMVVAAAVAAEPFVRRQLRPVHRGAQVP